MEKGMEKSFRDFEVPDEAEVWKKYGKSWGSGSVPGTERGMEKGMEKAWVHPKTCPAPQTPPLALRAPQAPLPAPQAPLGFSALGACAP